jgi:hypothetical protein
MIRQSLGQLKKATDRSPLRLIPQLGMGNARLIHEPSDLLGCQINIELLKRQNRVVRVGAGVRAVGLGLAVSGVSAVVPG